jgi:hypothetical protein
MFDSLAIPGLTNVRPNLPSKNIELGAFDKRKKIARLIVIQAFADCFAKQGAVGVA